MRNSNFRCQILLLSRDKKIDVKELSRDQVNSSRYPWSISKGIISRVQMYKEAYDFDSNDWVAQFQLEPEEARALSAILTSIPVNKRVYRCYYTSNAFWKINKDLCNYKKMIEAGFKGYFYNPSLCEAGCKQVIILWVNETNGESYIVGAPE